ncbi:MAG TPA: SCP2 sterol-binding domain-containing protein [Anaeromyxobacteraceae bacterium]|nr:SCP2 sterol-binding domain-containing protein [Anaeromyxobacteraceae bacterium]
MRFPSPEWAAALVAALNRQPDLPSALSGLAADLAAVVEAEPPAVPEDLAVWGRHQGGRIAEWRMLEDPDEILEIEPAYVVRASYRVWKALLRGEDPLQAALSGRVRVQGDLEALVRRARFRHVVDAALAAVPTAFADEAGGIR